MRIEVEVRSCARKMAGLVVTAKVQCLIAKTPWAELRTAR
jgi:hypothetical protein